MTVRITAIPRTDAPNSGYHPMVFAKRRGDRVWAIPGAGNYIGDYANIRFAWCESAWIKKVATVRILRMLALIAFFLRAVFMRRQVIFVHSFIFCLPLWAARQNYVLVIHGTDDKYLKTRIGRYLARRADQVLGVGFGLDRDGIQVSEVPNVFDLSTLSAASAQADQRYDVLFVLRSAPVKNPGYPFALFDNAAPARDLKIAVVGLDPEFLTPAQQQVVAEKTSSARMIDYLGRCPFDRVAALMKSSTVMILPSHSEGVAKAMLEALFCGLHVIVSRNLTVPEVFAEHLIRADLEDWQGMQKLIESCKREGCSERNKSFAQSYLDRSADILDRLYGELDCRSTGK